MCAIMAKFRICDSFILKKPAKRQAGCSISGKPMKSKYSYGFNLVPSIGSLLLPRISFQLPTFLKSKIYERASFTLNNHVRNKYKINPARLEIPVNNRDRKSVV